MFNKDVITKELIKEHYQDFECILLAAHSQRNFDVYFEDLDEMAFLERLINMDIDVKKEMALMAKLQIDKNVDLLFDTIVKIVQLIEAEPLSLVTDSYIEGNLLMKTMITSIVSFTERDVKLFSGDDVNEIVTEIVYCMSCNTTLITYLGLYHDIKWIDYNIFSKERQEIIMLLVEQYIRSIESLYRQFNAVNHYNSIQQVATTAEKAVVKKSKIIEHFKKDSEAIRSKFEAEIKSLNKDNKVLSNSLKSALEALEKIKLEQVVNRSLEAIEHEFNAKLSAKENELSNLHNKYSIRGKTISNLEKELDNTKNKSDLEGFKRYVQENGFTDELYQLLAIYRDPYSKEFNGSHLFDFDNIHRIGYCKIEKGIHYVVDIDRVAIALLNVPESAYLREGQFVSVSNQNMLRETFNYVYKQGLEVAKWGKVISTNPYFILNDHNIKEAAKNKDGLNPVVGQIVGIDQRKVITEKYSTMPLDVYGYVDSIKAKGHQLIYVDEVYDNGCKAYDLINNRYTVILLDTVTEGLKGSVVTINNGKIVTDFEDTQVEAVFYNTKKQIYYVEIEDKQIYIVDHQHSRYNLEIFYLPKSLKKESLEDGDIIEVGRFNHIYRKYSIEETPAITIDSKVKIHQSKQIRLDETVKKQELVDEKDLKILIIGKESMGNSYKRHFAEAGYSATVISGHAEYFKIVKKANKSDLLVFISTAAAHENYYKLKEQYKDRIIYVDLDGPNRLLERVKEWVLNRQ